MTPADLTAYQRAAEAATKARSTLMEAEQATLAAIRDLNSATLVLASRREFEASVRIAAAKAHDDLARFIVPEPAATS